MSQPLPLFFCSFFGAEEEIWGEEDYNQENN